MASRAGLACGVEEVAFSESGDVLLAGWVDDGHDPIASIELVFGGKSVVFPRKHLIRGRRQDVESALNVGHGRLTGFFGYAAQVTQAFPAASGRCAVVLHLASGAHARLDGRAERREGETLRDQALEYFARLEFPGSDGVGAFLALDTGLGDQLILSSRRIARKLVAGGVAEHFGPRRRRYRASVIVCLYGRAEYQFLQNALFSSAPASTDYEFIYVCNSPALLTTLNREAIISEQVYGLGQTILALPGNAGFGPACNAGAAIASSDRLLFVNPDVLPYDSSWATAHTALIAAAPRESTKLFGVPLFYSDGSLMHAGMYFDADAGHSVGSGRVERRRMLWVQHFGKGAPAQTRRLRTARPVPAVTGAWMSLDRPHFEALGGFPDEYIFGAYEDADLCLKSLTRGTAPWLHDLPFWHLEGKGGARAPVHEAASAVNRWHFSRTWDREIAARGLGRSARLRPSASAS